MNATQLLDARVFFLLLSRNDEVIGILKKPGLTIDIFEFLFEHKNVMLIKLQWMCFSRQDLIFEVCARTRHISLSDFNGKEADELAGRFVNKQLEHFTANYTELEKKRRWFIATR